MEFLGEIYITSCIAVNESQAWYVEFEGAR